jgi:hypothetical protein
MNDAIRFSGEELNVTQNKQTRRRTEAIRISCQTLVLAVCRRCGKTPDQTRVVYFVRISPTLSYAKQPKNRHILDWFTFGDVRTLLLRQSALFISFVGDWVRVNGGIVFISNMRSPSKKGSFPINKIPTYLLTCLPTYVRTYVRTYLPTC